MSDEIHVRVVTSTDLRCYCMTGDLCPLGRRGSQMRCSKTDLEKAGHTVLVAEEDRS